VNFSNVTMRDSSVTRRFGNNGCSLWDYRASELVSL